MLVRYQNFIDKHGKIVFPIYFLCLFLLFIVPPICGVNGWQRIDFTGFYLYLGAPAVLQNIYTSVGLWDSYAEFAVDFHSTIVSMYIGFAFAWLAVICVAVFLIVYYAKKKPIKPLLVAVPTIYIILTIIDSVSMSAMPFVVFYLMFVVLVFAILYCVKLNVQYEND